MLCGGRISSGAIRVQLLFAGTNSSVTGFASEKRRQKAPHRHGARAGPSRGGRRARLRWIRPSFVSMQASWRAMCGMSPGLDLSDLSEGPGCAGATGFRVFDICHAVHRTSPHLRNSATAFPLLSLRARLPTQSTRLASLRARFHDFFWRLSPEGLERSTSAAAQLPEKACALLARVCTGRHFTAVESNVRVGYFSTGMVFADLRPRKNDGIESPTQQTGGRTRRPSEKGSK